MTMPAGSAAGSAAPGEEPAGPQAQPQQHDLSHEEEKVAIRITQHPRQRLQVDGSVLLPVAATEAFRLITHPHNEQIFRHLEHCTHHEVLGDDGSGRIVVESEHVATWRLFALHGHLRTRLRVEQDCGALTSCFQLIHSRFSPLRTFQGRWQVQPQPPERCGQGHDDTAEAVGGPGARCCELRLEQELQPAVWLPPPLGGLLRQLACRQLRGVFQDLQAEAARINAGQPSLWEVQPP